MKIGNRGGNRHNYRGRHHSELGSRGIRVKKSNDDVPAQYRFKSGVNVNKIYSLAAISSNLSGNNDLAHSANGLPKDTCK